MGRDIGTNVYSNNFEPQVMGLLDARTRVDTKADLTKTATWTSADGNTYVPVGIRVSVTDDTTNGNNGVYMLMGEEYTIASNWMQINSSSGGGSDNTIYLTTPEMLDSGWDTELNEHDIDVLTKLYTQNNDAKANIVYVGTESGGNQFLVPLSCYSDFGGESIMEVMFLHPWSREVYHMTIDIHANPPIAYDPEAVIFGSGGGSSTSNVKVLTTPDLLNASRTASIQLSSSDASVMKSLQLGKDMVVYSGVTGQTKQYIPLSINIISSGSVQSGVSTFAFADSMYYFAISSLNSITYTASKPTKVEGGGGGESEVEIINLSEIAAVNDKNITASASLKAEFEKLYDVVALTKIPFANLFDNIEGKYPISIKDDSYNSTTFTVLFYNELWEVNYNRTTSTYSTTKVENGQEGGSNNTYTTTLPILKILDGKDDCFRGSNYTETLNVIEALSSGKQVAYNDYTENLTIPTDLKAGIGNNGILNAYYEFDPNTYVDSNILVFTGINSKRQLVKATAIEGTGSTILEVIGESTTSSESHDLSLDVKAGSDGIYYRIREVVPNGYIQFVRKKKKRYFSISLQESFSQTTYSPMGLSFDNKKSGVDVSTLTPNVWYKFPITDDVLVNTYTAGSKNSEGVIVTYDMFKFSGNTHARPILFNPNGGSIGSKRTTVLNAGLQYNVLDTSFANGKSAKTIFKQRGDIRRIDVRLSVNNINTFSSGYKLVYAVK